MSSELERIFGFVTTQTVAQEKLQQALLPNTAQWESNHSFETWPTADQAKQGLRRGNLVLRVERQQELTINQGVARAASIQ